jgi:PAS domain-containing protein
MRILHKPANDFDAPETTQEAGIFTWVLASNTVYADSALSELYGLDQRKAESGLPIEDYLSRIHVDDKPPAAKRIHDSIVTGLPYQSEYRVANAQGRYTTVTSFGRCFRDASGNPSHYAGIVFPANSRAGQVDSDLMWHCVTAYEMAVAQGKDVVARLLLQSLRELRAAGN